MGKKEASELESISDIIAKSSNEKLQYDPKLLEMFNRKAPSKPVENTPKAKVVKTSFKVESNVPSKEVRLSNKDAASIRVQAKLKSQISDDVVNVQIGDHKRMKKPQLNATKRKASQEILSPTKKTKVENSGENYVSSATAIAEKLHSESNVVKSHAELNAPKEKDMDLERRTVFVGNVPKELKKSKLKQLFRPYGTIEAIRFRCAAPAKPTLLKKIALRKNELHPDSSSIVAYIRFLTRKEAKKAMKKLNGFQLEEHFLTVDLADNKQKDNKKAVFVGNLHLKIQEHELRSFFTECGVIHSVRVVRDSATGMGKGFGYVNFENSESVELALKLDGTELKNRPLRVKRAVKKEKLKQRSQGERQRVKSDSDEKVPKDSKPNTSTKVQVKVKIRKEIFSGDRLSEIGKLKRKPKKPNKDELKKARIVKQLTGVTVNTQKHFFQKKHQHRHVTNQK